MPIKPFPLSPDHRDRKNRPGFSLRRPLVLALLILTLAAGFPAPAQEPQEISIFEMSGKALLCELEKRLLQGTVNSQDTKLLANIYIFYRREMSRQPISLSEEESIYQSFKSTAAFLKNAPPEEKEADLKAYRARCE